MCGACSCTGAFERRRMRMLSISTAAADAPLRAATVRTAVADDYGKVETVGRNDPCWCGSGKKFKRCHGA